LLKLSSLGVAQQKGKIIKAKNSTTKKKAPTVL